LLFDRNRASDREPRLPAVADVLFLVTAAHVRPFGQSLRPVANNQFNRHSKTALSPSHVAFQAFWRRSRTTSIVAGASVIDPDRGMRSLLRVSQASSNDAAAIGGEDQIVRVIGTRD
jgi:hypothetical protein